MAGSASALLLASLAFVTKVRENHVWLILLLAPAGWLVGLLYKEFGSTVEVSLPPRGKLRFRVATTDSRHDLPSAPNRLNRNFSPPRPDTAWSGDITYIATEEG
ncbi:MAG: hypothetical protein HIU87_01005 [Acidobacteria bacterium]|nr:hypothetical protein [Acidobacteriota bacterium]